jgi:polysaccharide biosynthesis protein PslG
LRHTEAATRFVGVRATKARSLLANCLLLGVLLAPARSLGQEKLWGSGLHLGGIKSDFETAERALTALGANTFRDDLYWAHVEQKADHFELPRNLSDLQKLLVLGGERGLRGVLVLDYGNKLHFKGLPKTDADRDAYARYVSWVARGYGKSVAAFEVWNEWNIGGGTNPRENGSAADYVKLLKRVRPVLKADAPGVPVIAGGLANRQMGWVHEFIDAGGFNHCDGFSVHPYNHHDRDASAEDVWRWLDELHAVIKAKTKKSIPLWITEIGWPNHDGVGASTEAVSAQRLLKLNLLLATRSYIRGVWWYDLFDDGDSPREMEHNFGLIRIHGQEKPGYRAFQLFLRHFKKARFVKDLSAEKAIALQFKGSQGERLVAVWAREGQTDKQVTINGKWTLIPIEGADGERISKELQSSGSAALGAWPALFELAPDAKLKLSSKSPLAGCAP